MPDQPIPPELNQNRVDVLTSLARSAAGALPFIGGAAAEILTAVIPNQRMERIVGFLAALDERLGDLEDWFDPARLMEPQNVDLLEDGLFQAARALSPERRERLAALVTNGLTRTELLHIEKKKLLSVLGELNDAELIILQSYLRQYMHDRGFEERHADILHGPQPVMSSPAHDIDRGAVHDTYRNHLTDLGLLERRFRRPNFGESPEFDERTGMLKSTGFELTRLGGLLLRYVDLTDQEY